jgi:hypothetical protein
MLFNLIMQKGKGSYPSDNPQPMSKLEGFYAFVQPDRRRNGQNQSVYDDQQSRKKDQAALYSLFS